MAGVRCGRAAALQQPALARLHHLSSSSKSSLTPTPPPPAVPPLLKIQPPPPLLLEPSPGLPLPTLYGWSTRLQGRHHVRLANSTTTCPGAAASADSRSPSEKMVATPPGGSTSAAVAPMPSSPGAATEPKSPLPEALLLA